MQQRVRMGTMDLLQMRGQEPMRHDEILNFFLQARSIARIENGVIVNQQEVNRLIMPALEKYAFLVESSIPFRPPYRIEESLQVQGGVSIFLVPHRGGRVPVTDVGLYMGADFIKKTRQKQWEDTLIGSVPMLFGVSSDAIRSLSKEDQALFGFIRHAIIHLPAGVKLRKQTGHYGIAEVVSTFKAYHEDVDKEALSLAARTYNRLTFERYVNVRNHKKDFQTFEREGALGVRHLYPELVKSGFCDALLGKCTPQVIDLLREKSIRYLYNIHDFASNYLNAEESIISLSAVGSTVTRDPEAERCLELEQRAKKTVEGLNEAVRLTQALPPEQLLFAFFSSAQTNGIKPFVATCTLFADGRQRMRDLMPHVNAALARSDRMTRLQNEDCRELISRVIHNKAPASRGIRTNDVLFKFVENRSGTSGKRKLLAFYVDPESCRPVCRVLKNTYLNDQNDPGALTAQAVSKAGGFFARRINDQISERPSRLFSLIGTDLALDLYANTPQGARMLKSRTAHEFLARIVSSSVKKMDRALFEAALLRLNKDGHCLSPQEIQHEDRTWLLKEANGEFLSAILRQPYLQGSRSACIDPTWIDMAITLQASVKVVEQLIDHLKSPLPETTLAAFNRYHDRSEKITSFLDSCKMISSIQGGAPDCQDFHGDPPLGAGRIPRAAIARNTL